MAVGGIDLCARFPLSQHNLRGAGRMHRASRTNNPTSVVARNLKTAKIKKSGEGKTKKKKKKN
jgi:hypothetical protein